MPFVEVPIDCDRIVDDASFHGVFAKTFGFAGYYGRNMNAWIDIMSSMADGEQRQSQFSLQSDQVLVLKLSNVAKFASRCPKQYADLIECSAFVNWRQSDAREGPLIALAFHD